MATIDRNQIVDQKIAKYNDCFNRGLITENEKNLCIAELNVKRYKPVFVYCSNAYDYWNIYTIADSNNTVIGTLSIGLAGRVAGEQIADVWAQGYTKRDIKRLFKEYR